MRKLGRLTAAELKKLLLVSHVIVGKPITERERDEAGTRFDRQGTEAGTKQHEVDEARSTESLDGDA